MTIREALSDPELQKILPGVGGAAVAMVIVSDPWPRRLAMFFAGAVLSYFATEDFAAWFSIRPGLAGFLAGALGMAIVAKLLDVIRNFELGAILTDLIRKRFG